MRGFNRLALSGSGSHRQFFDALKAIDPNGKLKDTSEEVSIHASKKHDLFPQTPMTVRNLEFLFRPRSIAVVAEPDEPGKYAEVALRNLAEGGFSGPVVSVAAKKRSRF